MTNQEVGLFWLYVACFALAPAIMFGFFLDGCYSLSEQTIGGMAVPLFFILFGTVVAIFRLFNRPKEKS